jgi:hypothetical protein
MPWFLFGISRCFWQLRGSLAWSCLSLPLCQLLRFLLPSALTCSHS